MLEWGLAKAGPFFMYGEIDMLIEAELEVGKVYGFKYTPRGGVTTPRVALFLGGNFFDFNAEDYRNFKETNMAEVKDLTPEVWVRDSDDVLMSRYRNKGVKVYDDGEKMWVVNL